MKDIVKVNFEDVRQLELALLDACKHIGKVVGCDPKFTFDLAAYLSNCYKKTLNDLTVAELSAAIYEFMDARKLHSGATHVAGGAV
jgi:hypothetical protein